MVQKSQHQYQVKLARSTLEERGIFCIAPTHGWSGVGDVDDERQNIEIRSCGARPGFSDDNGVEIGGDDLGAAARYQLTEVPRIAAEVEDFLGRNLTGPGGDPLVFPEILHPYNSDALCKKTKWTRSEAAGRYGAGGAD